MAKTNMLCPFNQKICDECPLYRGRHYYLSLCTHYRGYIGEPKAGDSRHDKNHIADIDALDKLVKPWSKGNNRGDKEPDIRLKGIDMETAETRIYRLEEAKNWDWSDTNTIRLIDGFHITGLDKLLEILRYKAGKGYQEILFYEGPRFMLLGGG
ncbi:hypothetical protein ACFLYF_04100 [Chloroflexota bacterium]